MIIIAKGLDYGYSQKSSGQHRRCFSESDRDLLFSFLNAILNNFERIEERFAHDNISRIRAINEDQSKSLDTITHDWASWDETYDFIQDLNKEYEETYIVENEFLSSAKIDYLLYFDTEGKLVHGTFYDPEQKALIPFPTNLLSQLACNKQLFHHPTNDSHFTGLIMISEQVCDPPPPSKKNIPCFLGRD